MHLSDTKVTTNLLTVTFAITTLTCAVARRPDVGGLALGAMEWILWMIYLPIFFVRKNRSRVLLASGLAGLAGSDVLFTIVRASISWSAGIVLALEVFNGVFCALLLARILDAFLAMPAYVQKSGYHNLDSHEGQL